MYDGNDVCGCSHVDTLHPWSFKTKMRSTENGYLFIARCTVRGGGGRWEVVLVVVQKSCKRLRK